MSENISKNYDGTFSVDIPIEYTMVGSVNVQVNSMNELKKILENYRDLDLPSNAEYLEGSYALSDTEDLLEEIKLIEKENKE